MNNKLIIFVVIATAGIIAYMNKKQIADLATKLDSKWSNLHPEVKSRALQVLEKAENAFKDTEYTLHIFDGWRDLKEQSDYINGGTSFVNSALNSYHPWGLAVDFVFKDSRGNWTWEPGKDCAFYDLSCHGTDWFWSKLGEIIESVGFEWGGRWKSFDGPHAQYTGLGKVKDIRLASNDNPNNFITGAA